MSNGRGMRNVVGEALVLRVRGRRAAVAMVVAWAGACAGVPAAQADTVIAIQAGSGHLWTEGTSTSGDSGAGMVAGYQPQRQFMGRGRVPGQGQRQSLDNG